MKLLVVEDDRSIANSLKTGLKQSGYEVDVSETGEDAFFRLTTETYDLVILDWMLPGRSGIDILKAIRSEKQTTPVIVLTAKDHLEDRIEGLDSGADDYLVKPFDFPELQARIRSLLRRDQYRKNESSLNFGSLRIDLKKRLVRRSGQNVELTNREFELLEYLAKHRGNVVSRDMLTKDVWKVQARATSMDSVIDVHIARLRKKIDGDFSDKLIKTVRGVGFRLQA